MLHEYIFIRTIIWIMNLWSCTGGESIRKCRGRISCPTRGFCRKLMLHTTTQMIYSNDILFLGAAPSPAAPIMGVLESPWTSHPYKSNSRASWWYYPPLQMGRFVRAAHSPAAPAVWFVGAAQSPAAPTNPRCIKVHPLLLPPWVTHSNPRKKGWEALGTSQKLFY
jgi:hypothetical protein